MYQSLPQQSFPEKQLLEPSETDAPLVIVTASISLFSLLQVTRRSDPQFLDANLPVIIPSLVHVRITGGKGTLVDGEGVIQEYM